MISKLKNVIIALASVFAVATPVLAPAAVFAQTNNIQQGLCTGVNATAGSGGSSCNTTAGTTGIQSLITTVINIFSIIVGVVAVIMIIIGGFKYITSGGESSNISGAKNTILYALVGLVIVALAQFIVHFVLGNVTKVTGQ